MIKLNEYMYYNNTKLIVTLILLIGMFTFINADLGTFKQGEEVDLIQTCNNCTYCNLTSVNYPNSTSFLKNVEMSQDGTYFNYTLNKTQTSSTTGKYQYCYNCGNNAEKVTGCIDFYITISGNETPEGISFIMLGIIILFFGISGVFLYLSNSTSFLGFRIAYLLLAFVFLIGSVATTSIIATDSNLTSGINNSISIMLFALGLIFFVLFAYVLIEQTKVVLGLMQQKKGYELGY